MSAASSQRYDPVKYRTPTGTQLTCKGWIQEAALRMLLNNLDPDVAERPEELIVYGGRGKAARNFDALDTIIRALKVLETDETLLIQSGKPVGISGNPFVIIIRARSTIRIMIRYFTASICRRMCNISRKMRTAIFSFRRKPRYNCLGWMGALNNTIPSMAIPSGNPPVSAGA